MIDQRQAKLLAEAHCVVELLENAEEAQLLQENNPEMFDAYASLLCHAGIEIPSPPTKVIATVKIEIEVEVDDREELDLHLNEVFENGLRDAVNDTGFHNDVDINNVMIGTKLSEVGD